MEGQFRPPSSSGTSSSQGHLLLIILNLVLLAGISVFIYLNSINISDIQAQQESSSSNINDLKKSTKDLDIRQATFLQKTNDLEDLFKVIQQEYKAADITLDSKITDNNKLIEANRVAIAGLNTNLTFINKLKTDIGTFDTTGLGDLLTNLQTIMGELDTAHATPLANLMETNNVNREIAKYQDMLSNLQNYCNHLIINNSDVLPISRTTDIQNLLDQLDQGSLSYTSFATLVANNANLPNEIKEYVTKLFKLKIDGGVLFSITISLVSSILSLKNYLQTKDSTKFASQISSLEGLLGSPTVKRSIDNLDLEQNIETIETEFGNIPNSFSKFTEFANKLKVESSDLLDKFVQIHLAIQQP